ncbi:MAG: hypothetical protein HY735_36155 [Verrucomicrobia bacterium]|nr:hypothetical protein [Verrucomicrobiota bacterium]
MSEKKPKMAPLYGAAFGFNTDHRVKPVHFATGFFVSLLRRRYRAELLNNVVAFTDGRDHKGNYALPNLHETLRAAAKVRAGIGQRELHQLRKHLRSLANNDEAVFPLYGEKEYGCDYTTASSDILTRTRDDHGFSGHLVYTVLKGTPQGREVLEFAEAWMTQAHAPLRQVYQPLLDDLPEDFNMTERYAAKFGELDTKRVNRIAKQMAAQTGALVTLCRNAEALTASETRLRCLIVGLCLWLFRYLIEEGVTSQDESFVLLADTVGDSSSRLRAQSRWSYSRLREALVASFAGFAEQGRFDECEEAWEYVKTHLDGRPKFEEFYGTIALRSGLAQPRASRVPAKHFEPQPDTLRVLVLSVLPRDEELLVLPQLFDRLYATWGLVYGGRADDARVLRDLGYAGLDQDHDLTPNINALVNLLAELGLATRFSDGLVMCHSQPRFS